MLKVFCVAILAVAGLFAQSAESVARLNPVLSKALVNSDASGELAIVLMSLTTPARHISASEAGRLATALSPYSKWRDAAPADPNAGKVAMAAIAHATTRRLLDHVRQATGHPRRALRGRRR